MNHKVWSKPTVEGYMRESLAAAHDLRRSSRYLYETTAGKWVYPRLGGHRLHRVTPSVARAFYAQLLDDGIGMSALSTVRVLMTRTFRRAVNEGLVGSNPFAGIPVPQPRRSEVSPLTVDQVAALADTINPRYRVAVLVAAYAGLRIGEVGGLRVVDLDFDRRRIHVRQAVAKGGGVVVGDPKTRSSVRTVALPAFLVRELRAHMQTFPPVEGRVFTTSRGGYVHADAIYRAFKRAAAAAGVPEVRFHTLRHTAASLAIQVGAHPKVIQARLGHADIGTTLNTYGHLFDGQDDALAEALNRVDATRSRTRGPVS